jgi:DNA modification methylase
MNTQLTGGGYEPTGFRNKRDVWSISTEPSRAAHFAIMPKALAEPCILAGSAKGDTIFDPFTGNGTTGLVALHHQRNFVGIELNSEFAEGARDRIVNCTTLLRIRPVNELVLDFLPSYQTKKG